MRSLCAFLSYFIIASSSVMLTPGHTYGQQTNIDFYNGAFQFDQDSSIDIPFSDSLSSTSIRRFYTQMDNGNYRSVIQSLLDYRATHQMNDWLYYQLVRQTAQQMSAKFDNYARYTLYKWFLMTKSGFDARLAYKDDQLIFYVKSDDDISDLPYFELNKGTYICLNYHDYGELFDRKKQYTLVDIEVPGATNGFSYKVTRLPDFAPQKYIEKEIEFTYNGKGYHFNIKVNEEVNDIFKNYPIVDFETYFNIPLSKQTYESLIPVLAKYTKKLSTEKGIDYIMRFTRYAFLYEDDRALYGQEKRMPPEQTLLNQASDCDDRAALFFYLVKEIYNLPMIALRYPTHVTIAVQFKKPVGKSILYQGNYYSICEATPQNENLGIGQLAKKHQAEDFEIVYHYTPH